LPRWVQVRSEKDVHPHVAAERPELFEAYNAGTTELEVLNWLHATIRLIKPAAVLETGAADGLGTVALARACRQNGFGVVHSVELDAGLCRQLERLLTRQGLMEHVRIHNADSREFLRRNETVFDLGFFDSMCQIRAEEFHICLERGTIRQLAVFHDTSPRRCESLKGWPSEEEHVKYRADLLQLAADPRCSGFFESPLSRGLIGIFLSQAHGLPPGGS
jgi:predicted O-methyltransferase YrrM